MKVEKVTHNGRVRVVVVLGGDSFPADLMMAPAAWDVLRERLQRVYGPAEMVEREATREEVAMMVEVSQKLRGDRPKRGNGAG